MSTIASVKSSSTARPAPQREKELTKTPVTPTESKDKDKVILSGESTSSAKLGSLPNLESWGTESSVKKAKPTALRDLPHRMPKNETPEQKKTRQAEYRRKGEAMVDEQERRWKAMGGGIMTPTPGSPEANPKKLKARSLPYEMPKTESPEQKQARQDKECEAQRALHRKQFPQFRPIMTPSGS